MFTAIIDWIRTASADAAWTTSVCTARCCSTRRDRRAAAGWPPTTENTLRARGDVTVVRDAHYVIDGHLATSQGVSAGIDLALWLVGRLRGRDHARAVRRYIQYEPAPPHLADADLYHSTDDRLPRS